MRLVVPRDRGIASVRRRAAAAAIDAALPDVAACAAATALAVAAVWLLERLGHSEKGSATDWTKRLTPALMGAFAGLGLIGRNWRSPGMRVVGIRRVDVRTRGPVRSRSVIVGLLADTALGQIGRTLNRAGYDERVLAAHDEVERMRDSRPDADARELRRDARAVRRRHGVGLSRLAPRVAVHTAAVRLPALWSGSRQSLTERLAGTVVVDDR